MLLGNPTAFYTVGEKVRMRLGGHIHHTGEYVHSHSNGYSNKNNSITSRPGWEDTRVFWYLLKAPGEKDTINE